MRPAPAPSVSSGFHKRFAAAEGKCAHELFEEQVAQRPDEVALTCEEQQLTFAELNARANQLAHHLVKLGVAAEVTVGLCLDRSVELIVGLLGILKAGGAYVPLDPAVPAARRRLMLEEAGARVLVTSLADDLGAPEVVRLDEITVESTANVKSAVAAENLVYLIFTSGSTGRP